MSDYKTTDYCATCGESPDSGTHLLIGEQGGHVYVPPAATDRCTACGTAREEHTGVRHIFTSKPAPFAKPHRPTRPNGELAELMARARAAHEALPPEVQQRKREEQRLSFAYGNLRIDVPVSRRAFQQVIRDHYPHWPEVDVQKWLDAHEWDRP